jgi:hypothetical protein
MHEFNLNLIVVVIVVSKPLLQVVDEHQLSWRKNSTEWNSFSLIIRYPKNTCLDYFQLLSSIKLSSALMLKEKNF